MRRSYYATIGLLLVNLILLFYALKTVELKIFKFEFSLLIFLFFISLYGFLLQSRVKRNAWKVFASIYLLLMANGVFLFYAEADLGVSFLTVFAAFIGVWQSTRKRHMHRKRKKLKSRIVKIPEPIPAIEIIDDINPKNIKRAATGSLRELNNLRKNKRKIRAKKQ